MQKHSLNIIPTIEATLAGRESDMFGNEYYQVAWPSAESCIGLPSDITDNFKQSGALNRM